MYTTHCTVQVRTRTPSYYLDFTFQPGSQYQQAIPEGWTAFCYILNGSFMYSGKRVEAHHTVLLQVDRGQQFR